MTFEGFSFTSPVNLAVEGSYHRFKEVTEGLWFRESRAIRLALRNIFEFKFWAIGHLEDIQSIFPTVYKQVLIH